MRLQAFIVVMSIQSQACHALLWNCCAFSVRSYRAVDMAPWAGCLAASLAVGRKLCWVLSEGARRLAVADLQSRRHAAVKLELQGW